MKEQLYRYHDKNIPVHSFNTIIVGTGAAGYNAADCLCQYEQKEIAMVTENKLAGTSRNTGSDKQTYYKLSLSGGEPDSVAAMAKVLFDGQCMDGDHALCEAALSVPCFLKLVELGVPFPHNHYGEYVGYKTDHDPGRRATSVGPYTSRMMTECLEKAVEKKNIPIFNQIQILRILTKDDAVCGMIGLNLETEYYELFCCRNIVFATGGPAGMYSDSVYPIGHYGATGVAFEAGVWGKNLTEWQFGMASVKPRWNVSGTYMQALPRFVSTDASGGNEKEFLFDFFNDKSEMLSHIFFKGYQWPFDVRKARSGSSLVDLLVYQETCIRKRRVFLDFRSNPGTGEIKFDSLAGEAHEYLKKAGACFGTPIERLLHMNVPAVEFYRDKGVDLKNEMLEIAICAQHNNGGLSVNEWWETNLKGFFAVGEVSGTHGVYRPGGSALNAGQVGSTRAAMYIGARCQGEPLSLVELMESCGDVIRDTIAMGEHAFDKTIDNLQSQWEMIRRRMSCVGAIIRNIDDIHQVRKEVEKELSEFHKTIKIGSSKQLAMLFRLHETLICQYVYLSAMEDYAARGFASRGSALYTDPHGNLPDLLEPERFRFVMDHGSHSNLIQEVWYQYGKCQISWRQRRKIPQEDDCFENVWRSYRNNQNI